MKLLIDIVVIKNTSEQRRPYDAHALKSLGTQLGGTVTYLTQAVPVPEGMPMMVRAYLETFQMIHKVLVLQPNSRSTVNLSPEIFGALTTGGESEFCLYSVESKDIVTCVRGSRSRFARDLPPSLQTQDIRPSSVLVVGGDRGDADSNAEQLQKELAYLKQINRETEAEKASLSEARAQVSREIDILRNQRTSIQNELRLPDNYTRMLEQEQRKVSEFKRQLSKSLTAERNNFEAQLNTDIEALLHLVEELQKFTRNLLLTGVQRVAVAHLVRDLRAKQQRIAEALRAAEEAMRVLERQKIAAESEREEEQQRFHELERQLTALEAEFGGAKKFDKMYARCIAECPEGLSVDIEFRIEEVQQQLSKSINNPELIHRFEEKKLLLAREVEELKLLQSRLDGSGSAMTRRCEEWLRKVNTLQDKMNILFKRFMEVSCNIAHSCVDSDGFGFRNFNTKGK